MTYAGNMDTNITSTVAGIGAVENGLVSLERMIAYTK